MGQRLGAVDGKEGIAAQGLDGHAVGVFGADELAAILVQAPLPCVVVVFPL